MGEKPNSQRDVSKWATNGMLGIALLGGTPYVATLQSELKQTREAVIRLEAQGEFRSDQFKRIEEEQKRLREQFERLNEQLRDRKVVGRVSASNTVAGDKHEEE